MSDAALRNWRACLDVHVADTKKRYADKPDVMALTLAMLVCTHIVCRSGLSISAQASRHHYCSLRGDILTTDLHAPLGDRDPSDFEVMLFWERGVTPVLMPPFMNAGDEPEGYVSGADIDELIEANGGWINDPPTVIGDVLKVVKRNLDL